MSFWSILLQIVPIVAILIYFVCQKFSYWSRLGLRGPIPLPIVGNIWQFLLKGQVAAEKEWFTKYGKIYGTYSGFNPELNILDNELIKQVMVKDFHLFINRQSILSEHEIWQRNLFNLENDDWKRVRTIASPSFTSGKLKSMYSLMNRCINNLAAYLESQCAQDINNNGSTVISTKEVISGFSIDVIASTSFATDTNANGDRSSKNPFVMHGMKFLVIDPLRVFAMILIPVQVRKLFGMTHFFEPNCFNFFRDLARQVVKQRKETKIKRNDFVQLLMNAQVSENELKQKNYEQLTAGNQDDSPVPTIPTILSSSPASHKIIKTLDENEIIAQCILFFVAGFETTGSTISNCLFELAHNPEIQERLVDGLEEKLNDLEENSDKYLETVMTQIPYLEAVIKETLRKYPPIMRLDRRVNVGGYKLAGFTLQKNQLVIVPSYSIHHNPEYYPEPEQFNPDRFMPENKHLLVPYTYMPFGQGPRNCVGMRFANQVIKLFVAQIVAKFRFTLTADTPVPLQIEKTIGILTVKPFPLQVCKR